MSHVSHVRDDDHNLLAHVRNTTLTSTKTGWTILPKGYGGIAFPQTGMAECDSSQGQGHWHVKHGRGKGSGVGGNPDWHSN